LPSVKDIKKQSSLLMVLGKIGDSSALPQLRKSLLSKEADIKGAAIRALAEWPTSEPAADLMEAAKNSKDKVHRILALRGFVRLLGLDSKRSSEETIKMYQKAIALASSDSEKKRVLAGLANTKSIEALQIVKDFLQDKALSKEAEYAVVKISGSIYENFPQQTNDVLKQILQSTENEILRNQAQEIINKIGESNK
jgi:HEAT repeat protein